MRTESPGGLGARLGSGPEHIVADLLVKYLISFRRRDPEEHRDLLRFLKMHLNCLIYHLVTSAPAR